MDNHWKIKPFSALKSLTAHMNKYLLLLVCFSLSACLKEENPDPIRQLLFECYDATAFGALQPSVHNGLPETCVSTLAEEKFENNNRNWSETNNQDINFDLTGGIYQLQVKFPGGWYIGRQFEETADAENYQIDVLMRIDDPGDTDPFSSIVWKGENWKFLNFGINNAKQFIIRERLSQSDPFKIWQASTYSEAILPGQWNALSIRKYEGTTYFFINQVLVASLSGLPEYGNVFGFFLPGKSTTAVDDLVFKTWRL